MALKATDALRLLNLDYGCRLSYPQFNRGIVSGAIPAFRGDDGRSWLIQEADLPRIAEVAQRVGRSSRTAA